MIGHQPDMEVTGAVIDPIQLLRTVSKTIVDVVIVTPLKSNGEPKICHYLLLEYPLLIVVTQSANGEAVHLYQSDVIKIRLDDPSWQSILGAIREAYGRSSIKSTS